jgi:hypothetical protein
LAHATQTLRVYVHILKAVSSILVLIISLWIALSQPNLLMFGICMSLALISLFGLLSLRRIVFVIPFPVLAILLIASIFAAPIKGLMQEVMLSLQLLLVINAAEIGSSSIYFDRILRRMREPIEGTTVSPVARALKRYVVNLTGIITASFIVSSLFLFLGSMTNYKLEPLFLVAIATAILLLSLIFLGTNLPSSTTQTEKSIKKM